MAGLDRYVNVLRLFSESRRNWTVPALAEAVGAPTSTLYRTVRELVAAGFLEPSIEASFRLGPAFVEFDRLVRLTDPLVKEGAEFLPDLVKGSPVACVALLARLYGDRVICAADANQPGVDIRTSYERGRPMPLTRGATSKAILSQLPPRRLGKLLERDATQPVPEGDKASFVAELNSIRRRGYSVTRGEVDEGLVGIAVPVACPSQAIAASLSLVIAESDYNATTERGIVMLLVASADMLRQRIEG